jgi:hypothetical protein
MKLLLENWRKYINEVSGRALDNYTTLISREVVKALKDNQVKTALIDREQIEFKMSIDDILEGLKWVRDVYINLSRGNYVYTDAKYEFDLDATDEQRRTSDIIINVVLPENYDNSVLSELIPELKDSLRHELEHSSQPTDMLMKVQKKIPEGEVWKSLASAEDYYTSEAEVKAHVAGIYKKIKMLKEPAGEVLDDFLTQIWQTGMARGYSEQELDPLMRKIRDLWRFYMASRYPQAEIDWDMG